MSEIDEFKRQIRGEVEAARGRVQTLQAQAAEQYQLAKGQTEYRGVKYYFLTEESQKAFEQDPSRYVGGS